MLTQRVEVLRMSSFSRCCGLFLESPGIFSGPETFFVFAFKIKNLIILKIIQ